ncbi:hypothetical protein [Actinoplanes sp. NPDC051411]|uniref:TOTE conflict system archaeo-eukaryotic primase domain-containing protein n=1 Tax=Actinoplanes sp. NPDC051411 TaxID=3155522 RepID=UPI0034350EE1
MDDELSQVRHQLERVRAENVRLVRLLDLRGQDTTPSPEQLAAGRTVTMSSPVSDKLALYASLFRARTDGYAVRWENARTGTGGWMPAVAGGWRKGIDRRSVNYLPLTAEVVAAPALDTLFPAAPISFDGLLIQCAGRVVRAAPGKDTAEVHDYHDPAVPLIAASLQRRMPGYRALGFVQT